MPLLPLTGGNLEGAKLDAMLCFSGTDPNGVQPMARHGDGHRRAKKSASLQGTNPRQPPVNFYFDAESGLLVRVLRFVDTAVGRVPTQIDYSDYRDVSGIKMPFKWK